MNYEEILWGQDFSFMYEIVRNEELSHILMRSEKSVNFGSALISRPFSINRTNKNFHSEKFFAPNSIFD